MSYFVFFFFETEVSIMCVICLLVLPSQCDVYQIRRYFKNKVILGLKLWHW